MLLKEIKTIKSGKKELRDFGLVVGTTLIVLSGLLWYFKDFSFLPLAYVGTALVVTGLSVPKILKPLQKVWMGAALCMGWLVGRVLLSILFYLVITPLGVGLRLKGKRFLETRLDPDASSYWNVKETEIPHKQCERQY